MDLFYVHRGIVEDPEKSTVMMEKFSSTSKMAPQSSGSLRSNAGVEKGKEIAARLNIHRIHSQLRGLDSSGIPIQQITFVWINSFSHKEYNQFAYIMLNK